MNPKIWKLLRAAALKTLGNICDNCGRVSERPHVDHILPRAQFPDLALDPHNVQILCPDCNRDKSDGVYSLKRIGPNDLDRDAIRLAFIDSLVNDFETRQIALNLIHKAQRIKERSDDYV